jgi:putative ABC transport system permease protein
MVIPIRYHVRNVVVRWRSTLATLLGIALVVAVFVLLRSLASGLEKSSAQTGDPRNILVVRKGAQAESSSLVTREQLQSLQYMKGIALNAEGKPLISADIITLISAPRAGGTGEANLLIRGVTARGRELRPQVHLTAGRWLDPGKREVVVAENLSRRFAGLEMGGTLKAGMGRLKVVGLFNGGGSAYDSEVWMDADEARLLFERDMYSSLILRPVDDAAFRSLTNTIESDKRFALRAEREVDYYAQQTLTAVPIKILASLLGSAMSVGAIFAAMNTMYAAIGSRTREIGTLRVLGYSKLSILCGFLLEGGLLALLGGAIGVAASFGLYQYVILRGITFGTMNFQSFSETIFQFSMPPALLLLGLAFSVVVGLMGSILPAWRASQIPVISALKSL